MDLGTLLIVVGLLFAVVDCFVATNFQNTRATLLHVAVALVAIGVLVQGNIPLGGK